MWCMAPLEMNEGNSLGQGYNQPTGCSAENAPHTTFKKKTFKIKNMCRCTYTIACVCIILCNHMLLSEKYYKWPSTPYAGLCMEI